MAKYNSDVNLHKKSSHKRKFYIGLWSVVGLVVVAIFFFVYDLRINSGEKLESPALLGTIDSNEIVTEIDQPEFYMKINSQWELVDKPEETRDYKHYSYVNTLAAFTARKLDIYIGEYPSRFDTNKIQKVKVEGSRLIPSALSSQCFPEVKQSIENPKYETIEWSWNGVIFPCNPSSVTNIITAGDDDIILDMSSAEGRSRKFVISYTDHTNKPDNDLFARALKTFIAK